VSRPVRREEFGKGQHKLHLARLLPYLLDRRNRVLETVEVYKGSVNSSQVRVGEVFKEAIRKNSSAVIVIHNHPSGAPRSM
jgi:DNA repair protein RadC